MFCPMAIGDKLVLEAKRLSTFCQSFALLCGNSMFFKIFPKNTEPKMVMHFRYHNGKSVNI